MNFLTPNIDTSGIRQADIQAKAAHGMGLRNFLLQRDIERLPVTERQADEAHQANVDYKGVLSKAMEQNLRVGDLKQEMQRMAFLATAGSMMQDPEDYADIYNFGKSRLGIDERLLPNPSVVSPENFQNFKTDFSQRSAMMFKALQDMYGLAEKSGLVEQEEKLKLEAQYKPFVETYEDPDTGEWMEKTTTYNPQTKQRETSVKPMYSKTAAERISIRAIKELPNLKSTASTEGPMAVYSMGWRMNDDGSVYTDAYGAPTELPPATKYIGKRKNLELIKMAGEALDDGMEVKALLQDPDVQSQLKREIQPGVIQRIKGMTENKLKKWAAEHGIASNTKAFEALVRIQRMASLDRKKFLGVAVTGTELKTILSWLPDAGDNFEAIVGKMNVFLHESAEDFIRWLDLTKNQANMSDVYKAFGWDRWNMPKPEDFKIQIPDENAPRNPQDATAEQISTEEIDVEALGDQIQAEHPDWSKGQVANEIRRRRGY